MCAVFSGQLTYTHMHVGTCTLCQYWKHLQCTCSVLGTGNYCSYCTGPHVHSIGPRVAQADHYHTR